MAKYKAPYTLIKIRIGNSKKYVYYYRLANQPNRNKHSTGCTTEKEARAFVEQLLAIESKENHKITFGEFAKVMFIDGLCPYCANKKSDGKPVNSKLITDYRAYLDNYIVPYFKDVLLSEITPAEIRKWRNQIMDGVWCASSLKGKKPPAHETMNKVRRIFQISMQEAEDQGLIKQNPLLRVAPLSKTYKARDILTDNELKKLFPEDEDELLAIWKTYEHASMIYLMLTSGMRSGEIRALKWEDIDWKNKGIRISKAIKADNKIGTTKGREKRASNPPSRAFGLMRHWQDENGKEQLNGFIYRGKDGVSPSSAYRIRYIFNHALAKAGIEINGRNIVIHSLRHQYNTKMRLVLPADLLREVVGHKSVEMTDRYSHLSQDQIIRVVNKNHRKDIEKCWSNSK